MLANAGSELLREPNLVVPYKKPTGPIKINSNHPLSHGLQNLYCPIRTATEPCLITGSRLATPSTAVGVYGVGGVSSGDLDYWPMSLSAAPFTLFCFFHGNVDTGVNDYSPASLRRGTTVKRVSFVSQNISIDYIVGAVSGDTGSEVADNANFRSPDMLDGGYYFLTVVSAASATERIFAQYNLTTRTVTFQDGDASSVTWSSPLNRFNPVPFYNTFPGEVLMSGWSNSFWDRDKISSFFQDPYQFLVPA